MTGENPADKPIWPLSPKDPTMVRLQLPPLPLMGLAAPLDIHIDYDGAALDETIKRLMELRDQIRRRADIRH